MPGPALPPLANAGLESQVSREKPVVHLPVSGREGSRPYRGHPHHLTQHTTGAFDGNRSIEPISRPTVKLPPGQTDRSSHPAVTPHVHENQDLESRIRGLILQGNPLNDDAIIANRNVPRDPASNPSPASHAPLMPSKHVKRRSNQGQRKEQDAPSPQVHSMNRESTLNPTVQSGAGQYHQSMQGQPQQGPKSQNVSYPPSGQYSTSLPPHLRGSTQNEQNDAGFVRGQQRQMPHYNSSYMNRRNSRNQHIPEQSLPGRPEPLLRQLYNPRMGGHAELRARSDMSGSYNTGASLQNQAEYLDSLARREVPNVEITRDEYAQKERLRRSLEQACRKAISDWERSKEPSFVAENVELKCFGSLSTTFGTRDSDMDLLLVSPRSNPSVSSPDSELPRLLEGALLDLGYGARLLTSTRVSIIKFCEQPSSKLAELLRGARMKWEQERKSSADPAKSQASSKKAMGDASEIAEPAVAQRRTKDVQKAKQTPKDTQRPKSNPAGHAVSNRDTNDPAKAKAKTVTAPEPLNLEAGDKPSDSARDIEADDPSLILKSDEERARLYRLAIKEEWYSAADRDLIFNFIQAIEKPSPDPRQVEEARHNLRNLPNILKRYRPPPEKHLDFPKTGVGIQCDINFSNHLALHNSTLLRCYSLCDPRVRRMVLFVKAWSKKRKINSSYHGTLCSYGYVLMVLHYLINVAQPAVLPNLQHFSLISQDKQSVNEATLDGYDIRFYRNEAAIQDMAARGQLTRNRETVGSLLRGFFAYYGYSAGAGHFHWMQEVLSLRTPGGILPKTAKGWVEAKTETVDAGGTNQTKEVRQRYLLAIEDPFETHHNIGRTVVHNGIVAIRDEFRRAHNLVRATGIGHSGEDSLLAEADSKENLQYRLFGPRPRNGSGPVAVGNAAKKNTPASGEKPTSNKSQKGDVSTNDGAKAVDSIGNRTAKKASVDTKKKTKNDVRKKKVVSTRDGAMAAASMDNMLVARGPADKENEKKAPRK